MDARPTPLTDALWHVRGADERAIALCDLARKLERSNAELVEALRAFISAGITAGRLPDRNAYRTDGLGPIFEQARTALRNAGVQDD